MAGKGDIPRPDAWTSGAPTIGVGSVATPPAQGGITNEGGSPNDPDFFLGSFTLAVVAPTLGVGSTAATTRHGDVGDVYGSPDLSSQDPSVAALMSWSTGTPSLGLGSVAAPRGHGDVGDVGASPEYTSPDPIASGFIAWNTGAPSLGVGTVAAPREHGDIGEMYSQVGQGPILQLVWTTGTPTIGVGSVAIPLGHGDVTDPKAWNSFELTGFVTHTPVPAIVLNWTSVLDTTNPTSTYQIYRSDNGGTFTLLTTVAEAVATYTDTAIVSFHSYDYYVMADWEQVLQQSNTVQFGGDTQIFTISGTYNPAPLLFKCSVVVVGAGAGGQSGFAPLAIENNGGSAGAAGGLSEQVFLASMTGLNPIAITVGLGGVGGISTLTAANQFSAAVPGVAGGSSSFGSLLTAGGGAPQNGVPGQTGTGGSGTTQQGAGTQLGACGAGSVFINGSMPVNATVGLPQTLAPGAGGGGGLVSQFGGGVHLSGAAGGSGQTSAIAPSAGGAMNNPGANADMVSGWCGGGGGGGDGVAVNGINGGNGGLYGAGGGGGGCGFSQVSSYKNGNGGNGANGVVVITESLW